MDPVISAEAADVKVRFHFQIITDAAKQSAGCFITFWVGLLVC